MKVTSVLVGGAKLADNVELGDGAQGLGVEQHEHAVHAEDEWLARGGHRCAHRRHGARRRSTEG